MPHQAQSRKRGPAISSDRDETPANEPRLPRRLGPLRAFAYPQYRIFWAASLVTITSFFMTSIARGWLIQDLTGSAFLVTTVNAMGMVPVLVFSMFGGAIADRMNRRLILIASDTFNLLVLLALAILVVTDIVQVWHVFALSLLHGIGFSLGMPARTATVSNLVSVDDMTSGVSLFSTIFSSGQLVGPALAGYLINAYGMGAAFVVACLTIAPALVLLAILRISRPEPSLEASAQMSVLRSIGQGFGYVRQSSILMGLMLMGMAITVFAMPYQAILPVFADDVLDVGPSGLGWLGAMGGVGAIAGSITVATFSAPRQIKVLMISSGLGLGVFIALFAVSTVYVLSLAFVLVAGYLFQMFITSNYTLIQIIPPDYIRGRVLSIRMIVVGAGPVGMVLLGTGAEAMGPAAATALMGMTSLVLLVAILLRISSIWRVESEVEEVVTERPARS